MPASFLLTSVHECHSMTLNEALLMGTPLLVTEGVNFPELDRCGAGRVLPCDPVRIAEAVAELLDDPSIAQRMNISGKAYARDHLTWAAVARTLLDAYGTILGTPHNRLP